METSVGKATQTQEEKDSNVTDFFRLVPLYVGIPITLGLIFYLFVCFNIEVLPLHLMGPVGQFVLYLANNHMKLLRTVFRFLLMAHIFEGAFAYRICRRMKYSRGTSFKWLLQTTVMGFPSLGMLLRHRKDRQEKSQKNK